MKTTSVTVMVVLFESSILKVTRLQLCSKFLLKIYVDFVNRILKDALQLNNLRTWINIRAKSSIETSGKIMKQISMKVP